MDLQEPGVLMDLDTRLALVGPMEPGSPPSSSFMEICPNGGNGSTAQPLEDGPVPPASARAVEMDLLPSITCSKAFPDFKDRDGKKGYYGRYGLTGKAQTSPLQAALDGQSAGSSLAC